MKNSSTSTFIRIVIALSLGLLGSANASTITELNHLSDNSWQSWPLVGEAQLSWFIFDIYQSRLTTPNGEYLEKDDITPHPLALTIEYQRDISRDQLIDATQEQWEKLGINDPDSVSWLMTMKEIYPDIREGDQLSYVTDGKVGTFYHSSRFFKNRLIGKVESESLNDAFLSIWLAPNSEFKHLRDQLVGANR